MATFARLSFPLAVASIRKLVSPVAGRVASASPSPRVTAVPRSSQPPLFAWSRLLFSISPATVEAGLKPPQSSFLALRLSRPRLGGSLEDYYTHAHLATCIQSPWPFYMWMSWAVLMAFVSIGFLLQSNYYFAGRMLPKASGNTQLCEDSW